MDHQCLTGQQTHPLSSAVKLESQGGERLGEKQRSVAQPRLRRYCLKTKPVSGLVLLKSFGHPHGYHLLLSLSERGLQFYAFMTLPLEMVEAAFHPRGALCGYELHWITAPPI